MIICYFGFVTYVLNFHVIGSVGITLRAAEHGVGQIIVCESLGSRVPPQYSRYMHGDVAYQAYGA